MALKFITAEEAASYVHHNDNVGFSGFTPAGCPKVVPGAIARKAAEEHAKGNPFQIGMFTGASTGDKLDGELARANAIKFRTPYQSNKDLRAALNAHQAQYFDLHLSELAQSLRYGFLGKIDVAIVEAADVTEDGEIVPTSGVGILPTICRMADRIIVELNCRHPKEIRGMHDIYEPADPPLRREIPIYTPSDRIGNDCVKVDPAKIVGVVRTDEPNEGGKFSPLDDVTMAIGKNVADFLVSEIKAGRLPKEFVPLQSGVGNVANAVLGCMGANESIPAFNVYTEVIQDAVIELMKQGRVKFASGCSLSVSNEVIREIYANLDFFKDIDDIRHSFKLFTEKLPSDGTLIINTDIDNYEYFYQDTDCEVITFGSDPAKSMYSASDITYDELGRCTYSLLINSEKTDTITLGVPGLHNVYNSLAAIAAARKLSVDMVHIKTGLSNFKGTNRRFEKKGTFNGVTVIDDYAHHPDEIRATLASAAHYPHNHVWVVFQPHTYSRTKLLFNEFADALSHADKVVLAKIYAARETDTLGISSADLCEKIQSLGKECIYIDNFEDIEKYLLKNCINGDLLITMGAGDVYKIGEDLLK